MATACSSTTSVSGDSSIPDLPRVTIDRANAVENALVVWDDFWADAMNSAHNDLALQAVSEIATPRVVEEATAPFTDGQNRSATGSPIGVAQSDGSVIVDDCLTFDPPLAENTSIWFSGRVRREANNELRIDVLTLEIFDCTPEQVAAER